MYHVRTLASLSYYRYVFGLNYGIFTVFKPILVIRNIVLRGIYGCVPAWSYLFCGGVDSVHLRLFGFLVYSVCFLFDGFGKCYVTLIILPGPFGADDLVAGAV